MGYWPKSCENIRFLAVKQKAVTYNILEIYIYAFNVFLFLFFLKNKNVGSEGYTS